jgi:hypothetical protein
MVSVEISPGGANPAAPVSEAVPVDGDWHFGRNHYVVGSFEIRNPSVMDVQHHDTGGCLGENILILMRINDPLSSRPG